MKEAYSQAEESSQSLLERMKVAKQTMKEVELEDRRKFNGDGAERYSEANQALATDRTNLELTTYQRNKLVKSLKEVESKIDARGLSSGSNAEIVSTRDSIEEEKKQLEARLEEARGKSLEARDEMFRARRVRQDPSASADEVRDATYVEGGAKEDAGQAMEEMRLARRRLQAVGSRLEQYEYEIDRRGIKQGDETLGRGSTTAEESLLARARAVEKSLKQQQESSPTSGREETSKAQKSNGQDAGAQGSTAQRPSFFEMAEKEGVFDQAGIRIEERTAERRAADALRQEGISPEVAQRSAREVQLDIDRAAAGVTSERMMSTARDVDRVRSLEAQRNEMSGISTVENYGEAVARRDAAAQKFESTLSNMYASPQDARRALEQSVEERGFSSSVKDLQQFPEKYGEIKTGGTVGWKDREAREVTVENSAEGLSRYREGSMSRAAAENDLAKGVERIVAERTGQTVEANERQAAERSMKGLQQEYDRVSSERVQLPTERQLKRELSEMVRRADPDTLEQFVSKGERAAASVERDASAERLLDSNDRVERAFKTMYKDPKEARKQFEDAAYREGLNRTTASFKGAEKKLYERPETFGEVRGAPKERGQRSGEGKENRRSSNAASVAQAGAVASGVGQQASRLRRSAEQGEQSEESKEIESTGQSVRKAAGQASKIGGSERTAGSAGSGERRRTAPVNQGPSTNDRKEAILATREYTENARATRASLGITTSERKGQTATGTATRVEGQQSQTVGATNGGSTIAGGATKGGSGAAASSEVQRRSAEQAAERARQRGARLAGAYSGAYTAVQVSRAVGGKLTNGIQQY